MTTYKVAHTIQPGEYSTSGGTEGTSHEGSVAKVNGNRNVPYLNRNDSKRNLNLNWFDNDWNANYRFLAVRHFHDFSRFNRREFCLRAACAIRRASDRLLREIPRGVRTSSYQALACPMRAGGAVSGGQFVRCIDQQALFFPHARCSSRGSNTQSREGTLRLFWTRVGRGWF